VLGTDIVDLKRAATESNWQRKGWLAKQFTPKEISWIKESEDSDKMVWRLWSMKESAYKVIIKEEQKAFFAPIKLQCKLQNDTAGLVLFQEHQVLVQTESNNQYIYTFATNEKRPISLECIQGIQDLAERELNMECSCKKNDMGIPELYHNNKKIKADISISHHGRFGSYAFLRH